MVWWISILICSGFAILYIALRSYINTLLGKEAKFQLLLKKLQRETEAIIVEFNRITDRNVTVAEECARKLKALIEQGQKQLTRLSRARAKPSPSLDLYSPESVSAKSAHHSAGATRHERAYAQIHALIDSGMSKEDIAARVGVSISEVEMALVMRDN